jgi:hypothetical protein
MHKAYAAEKRCFIIDEQPYHFYKNTFKSIRLPKGYVLHKDPTVAGAQIDLLRRTDGVFKRMLKKLIRSERVRYFNDRDRNQTIVTIEEGVCKQIGLGKEGFDRKNGGRSIYFCDKGEQNICNAKGEDRNREDPTF